ncbi:hypothetical protein J7K24_03200 [bacterium]|nr:hypothetical protein [bacterium]
MGRVSQKDKVSLEREYVEELKRKALLLEEILSFVEDQYLGYLMKKAEKEKNISISKAKKRLR